MPINGHQIIKARLHRTSKVIYLRSTECQPEQETDEDGLFFHRPFTALTKKYRDAINKTTGRTELTVLYFVRLSKDVGTTWIVDKCAHTLSLQGWTANGQAVYVEEGSNLALDDELMNLLVLNFVGIGKEKSVKYMQVNNLDVEHKVNRSEKDVSLLALTVTSVAQKKELDTRIAQSTSVNRDTFMKKTVATIPILQHEIDSIQYTLNADFEIGPPIEISAAEIERMKKPELVSTLINLRKQLYALDNLALDRIKAEIKDTYEAEQSSNAPITQILLQAIYKLSDDVLRDKRYAQPPSV